MEETYDVVIIGAGAAGMTAAIYAIRYKLKTLLIASEIGGTINEAHIVENWPGIVKVSGLDLMMQMKAHVDSFKVPVIEDEVIGLNYANDTAEAGKNFKIVTKNNDSVNAKAVILAIGTKRRQLNVKGEKEFLGKGVSYCATCDAPFYKGKVAVVIGGANSACMASVLLSEYCEKVYQVYRQSSLRAEPTWVDRVTENKKIQVIYEANVTEIHGEKFVEKVKLDNGKELKVDGVFIEVGAVPNIALIKNLNIEVDKADCIIVDSDMKTNVPGACAAGDVTNTKLKQLITAAGDGARAALSSYKFVKEMKK
ncbi:MAG: FAD-dependent oxidoreductase [Nanoarchaeota archaeon]|nr:FAD-dependent oxidoreductase [Nanoarchaeota archaeon]